MKVVREEGASCRHRLHEYNLNYARVILKRYLFPIAVSVVSSPLLLRSGIINGSDSLYCWAR